MAGSRGGSGRGRGMSAFCQPGACACYFILALLLAAAIHWQTQFFDHSSTLLWEAGGRLTSGDIQRSKRSKGSADPAPLSLQERHEFDEALSAGSTIPEGSCEAAMRRVSRAEQWCQHVEALDACRQQLRRASLEICGSAGAAGGAAVPSKETAAAAVRELGELLRDSVEQATRGGGVVAAEPELRCSVEHRSNGESFSCQRTATAASCRLQPWSLAQPTSSASICTSLLPPPHASNSGCTFYAYGASTTASDASAAVRESWALTERFACSGLAFEPGAEEDFQVLGRVAVFRSSAPVIAAAATVADSIAAPPPQVKQLSGHQRVAVLKLHCKGLCEYQLAQEALAADPAFFLSVDQVLIELHADDTVDQPGYVSSLGQLLVLLREAGLQLAYADLHRCPTAARASGAAPPSCSPSLKAAGFYCSDREYHCASLLWARLPGAAGSIATAPPAVTKPEVPAPSPQSRPWEPNAAPDFAGRTSFFQAACASQEKGGYAGLQLAWSPEEQTGLCNSCMLVGNYFGSNPDWQKFSGYGSKESEGVSKKHSDCFKTHTCTPLGVSIDAMRRYYDSVLSVGCCCTVVHDGVLPDDFVQKYRQDRFRFLKVDALRLNTIYDRKFGLNDARYFGIHEALCAHQGWQKVFFSDIFDVKVGSSPCQDSKPGTLYVGQDTHPMSAPFLTKRFREMGEEYLTWYESHKSSRPMWSAGIVGAGDRATLMEFLAKLLAVLTDPNIKAVKEGRYLAVNMAAVNYVVEQYFADRTHGGAPLHSVYRKFELTRQDVWFIHK